MKKIKEYIDESFSKSALNDIKDEFKEKRTAYATGNSLKVITKFIAEKLKGQEIVIYVPFNNFNCKGPADKIAMDVSGLTPFTKDRRIYPNQATTLFYGDTPIKNGNYIPFQSEGDVYYVEDIKIENNIPSIYLKKAPSYRAYL